jgi:hypothetical protein
MSTVNGGWRGPNIVKDGLVLYVDAGSPNSYPLINSRTTWKDISGNGTNGTLTNGPTFNSSNGGSIVFDGVDDFIEFGDVLDLGTNSLTVNQWVKLNTVSVVQTFLSKALAAAGAYRFSTGIFYAAPINRLFAFMYGNSGSDVVPYGSTVLTVNTWFMATYVFDRSSSIKIYYNGVQETLTGTATISQWTGLNFQSVNPFRIGSYTTSNNTGVLNPMNGNIAITQVYHRVLTQEEITQNFNATRSRFGV